MNRTAGGQFRFTQDRTSGYRRCYWVYEGRRYIGRVMSDGTRWGYQVYDERMGEHKEVVSHCTSRLNAAQTMSQAAL